MNLELFKQRNVIPYSAVFSKQGEFLPYFRHFPIQNRRFDFLPISLDKTCINLEKRLNKQYNNKFIFDIYRPHYYYSDNFIVVAIYDIREPCFPLKFDELNKIIDIDKIIEDIETIAESYHDYECLNGYIWKFWVVKDKNTTNEFGRTLTLNSTKVNLDD